MFTAECSLSNVASGGEIADNTHRKVILRAVEVGLVGSGEAMRESPADASGTLVYALRGGIHENAPRCASEDESREEPSAQAGNSPHPL